MVHPRFIAVDIGNSFVKLQLSGGTEPPWPGGSPRRVPTADLLRGRDPLRPIGDWLQAHQTVGNEAARWVVSSVHAAAEDALHKWVRRHRPEDTYHRVAWCDLPLETDVMFPERVGIDRLLNALAAKQLRGGDVPSVIVDAGSAVTVDALSACGRFQGGAILPGLRMASSALSLGTDQLPLAETGHRRPPSVIGRSTREAIHSGVVWGTLGAVREISERMSAHLGPETRVFITGGDAACFRDLASARTEFHDHLVLAGIRLLEAHLPTELSPP